MEIFDAYAKYYDLLYKDKDYKKESEYIIKKIMKHRPDSKTILDLGCGTGKHDLFFAQRGYDVTGVEISDNMIKSARKILKEKKESNLKLKFLKGDIRNIRIKKKFDIILSLFHVINYQSTNKDLFAVFKTVKKHLKQGGLFIFDFWYGPAVLSDRPVKKYRLIEDDNHRIKRFTIPKINVNENTVEINFKIEVKDKVSNIEREIKETHIMRYIFLPEISIIMELLKMKIENSEEWLTGKELSDKSWYGLTLINNFGRKK